MSRRHKLKTSGAIFSCSSGFCCSFTMQVFVAAPVFVPVVFIRLAVEDDMPVLAQQEVLSWQQTMAQQQMMA